LVLLKKWDCPKIPKNCPIRPILFLDLQTERAQSAILKLLQKPLWGLVPIIPRPSKGTDMYVINKLEGQTPLETLEQLRLDESIDESVPMTYAGRLDPMAEGLLLILVGDECKKKEEYLSLDKEYDVEVLLGVGSDTGDVLGMIENEKNPSTRLLEENFTAENIKMKLAELIGRRTEKYPAFSSKPINGKPMFMYAKEGSLTNLDENEIPQKEIEIYSIDFLGMESVGQDELIGTAIERIKKVKGDFRQTEIIKSWQELGLDVIDNNRSDQFLIIKLHIKSSSGAYMRTLAQKLGESLGTKALAWRIRRTNIGENNLETASL